MDLGEAKLEIIEREPVEKLREVSLEEPLEHREAAEKVSEEQGRGKARRGCPSSRPASSRTSELDRVVPMPLERDKTFQELPRDMLETKDSAEKLAHFQILVTAKPVNHRSRLTMIVNPGRGRLIRAMGYRVEPRCDGPRDRMHLARPHPRHPIPSIRSMMASTIQATEHTMEGRSMG